MFYAGYNSIQTDVAVFDNEEERDAWVDDFSLFTRISLTKEEALDIVGEYEEYIDVFGIRWLINSCNIVA